VHGWHVQQWRVRRVLDGCGLQCRFDLRVQGRHERKRN